MKHYFIEINESKSMLLLDTLPIYAGLVQKAFSQNVNVLMNNVVDKNRFDTEMGAWYKLNRLINLFSIKD